MVELAEARIGDAVGVGTAGIDALCCLKEFVGIVRCLLLLGNGCLGCRHGMGGFICLGLRGYCCSFRFSAVGFGLLDVFDQAVQAIAFILGIGQRLAGCIGAGFGCRNSVLPQGFVVLCLLKVGISGVCFGLRCRKGIGSGVLPVNRFLLCCNCGIVVSLGCGQIGGKAGKLGLRCIP